MKLRTIDVARLVTAFQNDMTSKKNDVRYFAKSAIVKLLLRDDKPFIEVCQVAEDGIRVCYVDNPTATAHKLLAHAGGTRDGLNHYRFPDSQ